VKGASVFLYLFAASFLANAIAGQWAFDFSFHGAGWVALDVVLALGCGLAAFASWRLGSRGKEPLWRRVQQAWQDEHAVHSFITAGRLLGLSGAVLLAVAVTTAHRWSALQQNWDRALPFGILALIFLGAGTSEVTRRWVLPGLGVVAAIVITLPFGQPAHGAWGMFIAAVSLLAFGAIMLPVALDEARKDEVHEIRARRFPATLGLTCVIYGGAVLFVLRGGGLAPAGWWGLGVLASGVLATAWEVSGFGPEIRKTPRPAASRPVAGAATSAATPPDLQLAGQEPDAPA
jgi:hypothetical protein